MADMIERLDFGDSTSYSAVEATIHLNRYAIARPYVQGGKRVLDVASGEGYGSYLLKKWGAAHVDGIDIDAETVEKAQHIFGSEDVRFQCHSAEELPFEDYSFDVICSFETVEHLDHPEKFLQEIRRVLRPGGTVIMSCPNDPYYYHEGVPGNPFHKKQYTYFDFKSLAESYLGTKVRYFLAFALNGFVNIPIELSTMPPEGKARSLTGGDMLDMLSYTDCNAVYVHGERYLNHWNSNYYVGIWGADVKEQINAAIFPRETFIEVHDEDVRLLRKAAKIVKSEEKAALETERLTALLKETKEQFAETAQKHEQELSAMARDRDERLAAIAQDRDEQLAANEQYIVSLKERAAKELNTAKNEMGRLSMMLELTTKERNVLQDGRYSLLAEKDMLQSEKAALLYERDLLQSEKAALLSERDLLGGEMARLQEDRDMQQREREALEPFRRDLDLIRASRTYRFMMKLGKVKKVLVWPFAKLLSR